MLSLTGCAAKTASVETDLFCEVAQPISWSKKDTDQTIKEVKAHNNVGKELNCRKINSAWKVRYEQK